MANNAAFEEALRLVLETSGTEGVDELRRALLEMGTASDAAVADTAKLVDKLADLNATAAKAEAFDGMLASLGELETRFNDNQKAALALNLRIGESSAPAKELVDAQRSLRAEGDKLKASLTKQWEAVAKADQELGELGVNTSQLASGQQRLRDEALRTAEAFGKQAKESAAAADEARRRNQQIEESDAGFRAQAKASTAAAESLKAYRERAGQAAVETTELGDAAAATSSIMGKLKGFAATALGFIGFRKIVDGIKSIVIEGSDAEQELGQINAALVATNRQAEFTAESLAAMRKQLQGGLFGDGEISAAQVRLLSYTNVVGEQFPKALQIAIDQAQRLGMGLEQSAEVVGKALQTPSKAMQALADQGFTLEASQKQLITQLEATGRVAEAQAIILDLLTESYGGAAAAAKVGTIAGLWKEATSRFKDWKQEVADQGVMSYFKAQLTDMLATADRLARDGSLARWAKQTADAIVAVAQAARGATTWVVEHSGALITLGKAFALLQIVRAVMQMNAWRIALMASTRAQLANAAAMSATGQQATALGNVLKSIPRAIPITIALLGLELAAKGLQSMGEALGEDLGKSSAVNKQAGEFARQMREQLYLQGIEYKKLAVSVAQYRDAAVKSSTDVAALSDRERDSYRDRLAGLHQYLSAQLGFLLTQKNIGIATDDQLRQLEEVKSRLAGVRAGYDALSEGARVATDALKNGVGSGAQLVIDKLQGIDRDSKLAASSIRELFNGLNFSDQNSLGDVGVALATIASQGAEASRNVRDGLLATLQQLSGEELFKFQEASQAAFSSLPNAAQGTAVVLEQTLAAALQKVGVSAEQMGVSFTQAGRDAVGAFGAITENALATSAQIEAAFKAALGNVATLDEARTLGSLLESAGNRGKIGFDQAARSAAALNARIRDITNALNPLNDEFGQLGIQSQAALNAARDAAKSAFDAIRSGAAQGKASVEDVRRAFRAYSDAALAAVEDSDQWKRAQVQAQLDVQGAAYRTNESMKELGRTGKASMRDIEAGAQKASGALQEVESTSKGAASGVDQVADSAARASGQLGSASVAAQGFSLQMGEVSSKTMELLDQMDGRNGLQQFANIWNALYDQREELAAYKKEQEGVLKGMDELSDKRRELASRFDLVGEGELEGVLQIENQIEAKRLDRDRATKRATEERLRAAEAEAKVQAEADAKRVGKGGADAVEVVRVEWSAPTRSVVASASAAEREQAERIADLVAPLVLQKLARSKSVSIRGGAR